MEIRVNRAEFLNELVPIQGVVERRTTIPVLSHLLLRASGERLELAATDLDVSLTSWCEGEVSQEGAIALQAKKLLEIVRACDGDDVTLKMDANGTVTLLCGQSVFKIRGLPAEDFPTLPELEDAPALELPFPVFRAMIGKIFFAISNEESRFQLSGALLERGEGSVALVATDSHRLALVEAESDGIEPGAKVLVPRKALQELQRFDGEELSFRPGEHHLGFNVGRRQLICRILEGTFPDYERVIAVANDRHVIADRATLLAVIQRVALLTGDRTRAIRVELQPGEVIFSAANPDLGEARESVACEYEGDELAIGLNPDYLRDFLQANDSEKVRLELKDENSQCVCHPVEGSDKRYVCVIMPIRL